MLAEAWPRLCQICRVKAATDVLPLVPVTAAIVAGCFGKNLAAASASARRGLLDDDERDARALRPVVACNRDRAGRNGGVDETRAVGLAAGERKEQVARLHRAAVDGQPPHLDRVIRGIDRGIGAKEVAKSHAVPVRRRGASKDSPAIAVDY